MEHTHIIAHPTYWDFFLVFIVPLLYGLVATATLVWFFDYRK